MIRVRHSRGIVAAALLLVAAAACGRDSTAPARETEPLPGASSFDPALGASAGQASLPGLTMEMGSTLAGPGTECHYAADVGRFLCAPVTRDGITITRSFAFYDASGVAQEKRNELTRSMNTQVAAAGTRTSAQGSFTIDRKSSLTVSGLGRGSTSHTLNGTESGSSTHSFTSPMGTRTGTETFTATTDNVVVKVPHAPGNWPLSGSTTRTSTMSLPSFVPDHPFTMTQTIVVTFNGTNLVPVTMTRDGVTRSCTMDLAARHLGCR